ncbi:hypothetical protein DVH24_001452 [Malus domestica]|uniref:Thioredoxin domain-containing protein n=1 Tax=Malus domestica TaxID=3750 RepID=A0A498K1N4_MALDO|nr:hypothetical protein DVH24_001452 [Malus domestica]
MAGGVGGGGDGATDSKKGLEGTGLDLPENRHDNLNSASSDQNLKDLVLQIKSCKSPLSIMVRLGMSLSSSTFETISNSSLHTRCSMNCLPDSIASIRSRFQVPCVCSQILPAFCHLSNSFARLSFIYADIDECHETTQHIHYTPTFHFYRDGERVDEMFGAGEERLHDRLWLHS